MRMKKRKSFTLKILVKAMMNNVLTIIVKKRLRRGSSEKIILTCSLPTPINELVNEFNEMFYSQ